jgi:hypothetical protein
MANNKSNPGANDAGYWIVALILLFAVWPVGLIMIISKLSSMSKLNNSRGTSSAATRDKSSSGAENRADTPANTAARTTAPKTISASDTAARQEPEKKPRKTAAKINKAFEKYRSSVKSGSGLLMLSAITLLFSGVVVIGGSLSDLFSLGGTFASVVRDLIISSLLLSSGVAGLVLRSFNNLRVQRYQNYLSILGTNDFVSITQLAHSIGKSERQTVRDLQRLIDKDILPKSAYIDFGRNLYVSSADAASADPLFGTAPAKDEQDELGDMDEYERALKQLRRLDDDILDESISYKITRIEQTSSKIFAAVRDDSSKLPQIRRFMNYYLPTTNKLLRSYRTLERQGIRGENIEAAKDDIDRILSSLADGFERQLDQLFKTDVMDIGADINVLENMLVQDGLAQSGFTFGSATGTVAQGTVAQGSAAQGSAAPSSGNSGSAAAAAEIEEEK